MTEGPRPVDASAHTRRAYYRDLDVAVESALRVARIDQRSAPARCRADEPQFYLDTVLWLLADDTFDRYQRLERQVAHEGETTERKLSDFAGGASA